jgi:hypothetical protein
MKQIIKCTRSTTAKRNISIFLLPSINGSTIFTAGVEKLRYKSTTSGSGRRSHRPLLINDLFIKFSLSPFIKQEINKYVNEINAYTFTEKHFSGSLVHAGSTAARRTAWCGAVGWFQAYTAITLQKVVST